MTKLNIKTYLKLILFPKNYSVKALFTIHFKVTLRHTRGGGGGGGHPPKVFLIFFSYMIKHQHLRFPVVVCSSLACILRQV